MKRRHLADRLLGAWPGLTWSHLLWVVLQDTSGSVASAQATVDRPGSQQACLFSQFWRLEVQSQRASKFRIRRDLPSARRRLPPHRVLTWPALCTQRREDSGVSSPSWKDTGPTGSGPAPVPFPKVSAPNTVTLGLRASTCGLWGDVTQSITRSMILGAF